MTYLVYSFSNTFFPLTALILTFISKRKLGLMNSITVRFMHYYLHSSDIADKFTPECFVPKFKT